MTGRGTVEHGFELFRDDELMVGYKYARSKNGVTLSISRLREVMNNAGKTRINSEGQKRQLTPREVITRALKAFERQHNGVRISEKEYQAYVHAGAKMFSERNLNTKTKHRIEREVEEIEEALHGIEDAKPIDPKVQYELAHGFTGDLFEQSKADT
ncbi:MAG: hypothetical protein V4436_01950 [Patescibacteria group bacterium]